MLCLSWYATTVGAITLLTDGGEETNLALSIFIGVFVAIFTLLMKYALDAVLFAGLGRKLIALPLYIALLVFSVAFGFAWWWERLQSGAETVQSGEAQLSIVRTFLREATDDLQNIDSGLAQLAARSQQQAALERTQGRTCEADVGAGDGPRRVFRDAEAERSAQDRSRVGAEIEALNAQIAAVTAQLNDWSANVSEAASASAREVRRTRTAELNSALEAIEVEYNGMRTDTLSIGGLASDYATDAELYLTGGQRSGPTPTGQTATFRCQDEEMGRSLESMASVIDALPPLEIPDLQSYDDSSEATRAAFQRFGRTFFQSPGDLFTLGRRLSEAEENAERNRERSLITAGEAAASDQEREDERDDILALLGLTGEAEGMREDDWPPLLIAGLVDLAILVMSLIAPRPHRSPFEQEARDRENTRRFKITYQVLLKNAMELEDDPQFRYLQKYLLEINGSPYIAVPKSGPNNKRLTRDDRAIANFVTILRGRGQVTFSPGPDPDHVTAQKVNEILAMKGSPAAGRDAFELYRLGRQTLEQIIRELIIKRDEEQKRDAGSSDFDGEVDSGDEGRRDRD